MPEVDRAKAPSEEIKVDDAKAGAAPKKGGGLKMYLIIIMVLQVVLAAGGYFFVIKFMKPDPAFNQVIEDEKKAEAEHIPMQIYNIDDVVVNPAGTSGSRYLSVSVGVEMDAPKEEGGGGHGEEAKPASPIDEKKPQLRDALIGILSAKTIDQLTSVEQKDLIRGEILDSFTKILAPARVHKIFFVDFVLQ
jgi:flagellar FliL protein